ncbi:MAG: signal recognition particle receptor subunit alpha, partial [Oscillospiraceae bacterium]
MGFFSKLKKIWQEDIIGYGINATDEAFFEDLEEMLILADVGMTTAAKSVELLRSRMAREGITGQEPVKAALREILAKMLDVGDTALDLSTTPSIVLVIGVNGVGKTTSIGKLGAALKDEGKRVLFCAAD